MSEEEKPKTSMQMLEPLLKEYYTQRLNGYLLDELIIYGEVEGGFEPVPPTRKEKWKKFWNHIPDFINYVRNYKYEVWRYYEDSEF
jgi:hypothetical protein